jgi:hypothetical protein
MIKGRFAFHFLLLTTDCLILYNRLIDIANIQIVIYEHIAATKEGSSHGNYGNLLCVSMPSCYWNNGFFAHSGDCDTLCAV